MVILIALLLLVAFWYSTMRAKEMAVSYVSTFCEHKQVELLDDTVCLAKLSLQRDGGVLKFARTYRFDYYSQNQQRRQGKLFIVGNTIVECVLTLVVV